MLIKNPKKGNKLLKIKDQNSLIKICKVISWLDDRRWNTEDNYNFIHFFRDDLTNCEKIFTHWICYITDRQMPFEVVWDKGGYVFSELVYEYKRSRLLPQQIIEKYYEKYNKVQFRFKSSDNTTFASRYVTDDYQNILNTLEVLNYYERDFISFILNIIKRFKDKEDLLIRIACSLHLLTYQLDGKKANSEETLRILNDEQEYEKKLEYFKKNATLRKKRLWCCIRDYKKGLYHKVFSEAIREIAGIEASRLISIWDSLSMEQIELPGDVWNNNPLFKNNLFAEILDIDNIPNSWGMPEIIRDIYKQVKDSGEINDFYPEQFDITFDFVPRMCSKKLCNVCPFGDNGVDLICIPTEDKYCPVALLSCGYFAKCVGEEEICILKEGVGEKICKGRA
jgi:hypothetical protein